jgi:hypothetical protein
MAIAIDAVKQFEGDRLVVYNVTVTGADSTEEVAFIDASTLLHPDGRQTGGVIPVLLEAQWSIHAGYDKLDLCYHDEGGDEIVVSMSGDGSYNAWGIGGGTIDVEAATPTEEDYDMVFDCFEDGSEDANATANIQLVFKKRQNRL